MRIYYIVTLALIAGCSLAAQEEQIHPVPGVSLVHFVKIDEGVYAGSKPKTGADFAFLQSMHIRNILNVKFLPGLSGCEKKQAKKYGIEYLSVPMNASFVPPSEKHVDRILLTMKDGRQQPIYLHCYLGRDRTSLIDGLYGINFLGRSKQQAWQTMKHAGFKEVWYLHGLKAYFESHSSPSPKLRK